LARRDAVVDSTSRYHSVANPRPTKVDVINQGKNFWRISEAETMPDSDALGKDDGFGDFPHGLAFVH